MNRSLAIAAALLLAATVAHSAEPTSLANLRNSVKAAEAAYESAREAADADFTVWLDKAPEGPSEPTLDGEIGHFTFESLENGTFPNAIRNGPSAVMKGHPSFGDGKIGKCFVFDGSNGFSVSKIQHFHRSDPFTVGCWIRAKGSIVNVPLIQAAGDARERGFSLQILEGKIVVSLIHQFSGNALVVASRNVLPFDRWIHLATTYDGSSKAAGVRIYLDGKFVPVEHRNDSLTRDIASDGVDLSVGSTMRGNELKGIAMDELRIFQRDLTPLEVAALAGREDYREAIQSIPEPSAGQRGALFEYYVATANDATREAIRAVQAARKSEAEYIERNR